MELNPIRHHAYKVLLNRDSQMSCNYTTFTESQPQATNGNSLEEGKVSLALLRDNSGRSPSRRCSARKWRLLIAFSAFLLLTALFAATLVFHYRTLPCTTESCVKTAARLLKNMNVAAAPCDDFYEFACGNWINTSINLHYNAFNTVYETAIHAQDTVVNAIQKIIEGTFEMPLNDGERAAAELYRQCTDLDTLYTIGLNTWLRFVDELGGWLPELYEPEDELDDDVREDLELEKTILSAFNYTVFPLFWAGVEVNYLDSSSYLITVYEQMPLMVSPKIYVYDAELTPEMIFSKQAGPQVTRIMQGVGEDLAELLKFDINNTKVRMLIAEMVHLDWMITTSGTFFNSEKKERYEIITLRELQRIAPAIDWRYFLSRLLGVRLSLDEPIALKTGREWLEKLSMIIGRLRVSRHGLAVLKNYAKWKAMLFHLAYVKPKSADNLLWAAVGLYSGPPINRKEFCFLRGTGIYPLSLPSLLRKIDGYENTVKNKVYVENMASNVIEEYKRILETTTVLDNVTKRNALDKLGNTSVLVSYPDKMNDETEMNKEAKRLRDELFWSMAIGAAEAYKERLRRLRQPVDPRDWVDTKPALSMTPIHNYERNVVQLPFDVVRSPLADFTSMDFANYGAAGTYIGHELTHAFDEQGKLHGPTGNLGHWWTGESRRKFVDREQCFVRHYTHLAGSADTSQAKVSLYENIADNVGLKVAYQAWQKHGRNREAPVPGLEKYSQDQLFFLSFAQSWCALKSKINREVHMEEKIRVLGSLQNSKEFAAAFSCPTNSFMNPSVKCELW
ncbi:unnamed protein product [Caenorhabditis auriculariae]|uniref:Uncharacterized protein n=1 Tax=Caenorhabditis auriculariae TaxID=2777116 RepID=A0A8S1H664_9PELO|nr:unnamed protein product [Caenorhabditis auriculariae]